MKMLLKTFLIICEVFVTINCIPRQILIAKEMDILKSRAIRGSYRLPANTLPLKYLISLETSIHLGDFNFSGSVTIDFEVKNLDTKNITLHKKMLEIKSVEIWNKMSRILETNVEFDDSSEDVKLKDFLMIIPKTKLIPNETYKVYIRFNGVLRTDELGFYRSSYNVNGITKWLATTQFEATEARSAFPCYDEPHIRTPVTIAIKHGRAYKAISNMPVSSSSGDPIRPGFLNTIFKETPKIQTYLIAFVISDFDYISNSTWGTTNQSVYARSQAIKSGEADLALKYGQEILNKYEEYLGIPYGLPKLDQVAVPDFKAGAMENYGLVTYREVYLLHNSVTSKTHEKEFVLRIISHEYAHQWFGNLVAPIFWSHLWMKEGMATLYEYFLVSLLYEHERLMDSFIIDVVQPVLETDGSLKRSMTYDVETPSEIDSLYDSIAYDKAGSVLRMFQNALGDATWRRGLKNYITARQFDAANSSDLYAGLQRGIYADGIEENDNVDIEKYMSTWEVQSGYPVVTVNFNTTHLSFSQKRFFYNEPIEEMNEENFYCIPINYAVASNPDFSSTKCDLWLSKEATQSIQLSNTWKKWEDDDWIIINIQQGYYYRVNYDTRLWNRIIAQLHDEHRLIHVLNRAQLIDDSLNLARADMINYTVVLNILSYLKHETDYVPWQSAFRGMRTLNRLINGLELYSEYKRFIRTLVQPLFEDVRVKTEENEHKFTRYKRSLAIKLACQVELETCLEATASRLDDDFIEPDVESEIYCNGLRKANESVFNEILERMFASSDQSERNLLIAALDCTEDKELFMSFLNLAVAENETRLKQDEKLLILLFAVEGIKDKVDALIEFVEENYETIEKDFKFLDRLLSLIASHISSKDTSEEFNNLLEELKEKEFIDEENMLKYQSRVQSTFDWQEKHSLEIKTWLAEYFKEKDIENYASSRALSTLLIIISCVLKIFL